MPPLLRRFCALALASASVIAPMVGCQSTSPVDAFHESQSLIQTATGQEAQWQDRSADEKSIRNAVSRLLSEPLTSQSATQLALINNAQMQAKFESLGIARAELVQAGLLKNPIFDAQIRWPSASPSGTNVEFAIVQDFISILLIPMKKKIAKARLREAVHLVTHDAIALASKTRAAWVQLQSATEIAELKRKELLAADAASDLADRLFKAGNISELEHARKSIQFEQAKIESENAAAEVTQARENLAIMLGLQDPDVVNLAASAALPDAPQPTRSQLEALAVIQRQDLAAKRSAVTALAHSRGLSKLTNLVPELNIGGDAERELDGTWLAGPSVSLQIPLFDQGQAQLAKADSELRQAHFEYIAMETAARSETRSALNRITALRSRLALIDSRLLPIKQRELEQAHLHNSGMLLSTFELLDAQRSHLETLAVRAHTVAELWLATIDLENAIAGPLASAPAVLASTQPATQPAVDSPSHKHTRSHAHEK